MRLTTHNAMGFAVASLLTTVLIAPSALAQRGAPDGEWPSYGGDDGSTKYAPLDQIDASNVDRLQVAWQWESSDTAIITANRELGPAGFKATPLMVDGVLYIRTSLSIVAAIDAETGQPIGRFGADGKVDLTQGLRRPVDRRVYQVISPPLVVGDIVIVDSSISDGPRNMTAPPGDIRGFDVRTGELRWTFHTVPQAGEGGNETWEDDCWTYTGNTNAWSIMSADQELGYVYLPIGTPTHDWYGGHRPGDNLFAESLVCLDAATGERVWHFQMVHHGLWDYDLPAAPTLVDITVDGRDIKPEASASRVRNAS